MLRSLFLNTVCFLFLLCATCSVPSSTGCRVAILPLGEVDRDVLEKVREGICSVYRVEVVILPARPLPVKAYYPPRDRYRADVLLEFLEETIPDSCSKVLGITGRDISAAKGKVLDYGIFGYGRMGGKPCLVSTFRLGRNALSSDRLYERVVKVVNHELGHTFGLDHCARDRCLMQDGEGTIRTVDQESGEFCDECRRKIMHLLVNP